MPISDQSPLYVASFEEELTMLKSFPTGLPESRRTAGRRFGGGSREH